MNYELTPRIFRLDGAQIRHPAVKLWFDEKQEPLRSIALRWFDRLRQCGTDVRELIHDRCPVACIGDAAFAYVNVYSRHINVGFYQGAVLDDPAGVLCGAGKYMRHFKLDPLISVNESALEKIIEGAYRDMRNRLAPA